MKKFVLLSTLVLSGAAASAQTNFRPGYVVPLAGDTLRGEVDARGEQRNALLCRFRPAAGAAVTEYTPAQLRAYGFSQGLQYQSKVLPTATPKPAFLQVLATGPLSAYHYANESDKSQYFVQKGAEGGLLPLVQRDTAVYQNSQQPGVAGGPTRVMTREYPFRNVLWSLMADCPSVQTRLTRMELTEAQLTKMVAAYNVCVGGEQRVAVTRKSAVRLGLLVGGAQAQLTYNNDQELTLKSSMKPSFGVSLQVQPSRFNPHLSLLGQALYVQQKYYEEYTGQGPLGPGYERTARIEFSSVQIPVLLRYSLISGVVRPYIQAGPVFALNLQRDAQRSSYLPRLESRPTVTPIDLRSYGIGGALGVGVAIPTGSAGSITLEARASQTDNTSEQRNLVGGARILSVLAGYTFGK